MRRESKFAHVWQSVLVVMLFLVMSALGSVLVVEPSVADPVAVVADADAGDAESATVGDGVLGKIAYWWAAISSVIGTFAVIAALTKTKRDDRVAGILARLVDFLGANVFNARNENRRE